MNLIIAAIFLAFFASTSFADVEIIENTTSPKHKFALATEGKRWVSIYLYSMQSKALIGDPVIIDDSFFGIPSRGSSRWSLAASLVAFEQGGIHYSKMKVFQYSKLGLKELGLPDLETLPNRYYPDIEITRTYVSADRWIGRERLRVRLSGTLRAKKQNYYYEIVAILSFHPNGKAKVVKVKNTPLDPF